MNRQKILRNTLASGAFALLTLGTTSAVAADWSDTYVGWRTGRNFAEPFNSEDISKNIFNFGHISGYKYGTNFLNVDFLLSDNKDPAGAGSTNGAQEAYVVYRHTLDVAKITGAKLGFGPVKTVNFTLGFDANAKTDAGYNSKKRMFVAGPTFPIDIPVGFLNVGVYMLWESNAPYNTFTKTSTPRYSYDPHPMLNLVWGVPLGGTGLSFEGFANFIASKGKNEFGGETAAETNIDAQVMYDASSVIGAKPKTLKVGLGYQYWKNKFGNDASGPAGKGAFAKTPMLRTEFHF